MKKTDEAKKMIAKNVNDVIKNKGKSTRDIATLLEITTEAARMKLNGTTKIDGDDMAIIGQYLDIPVARFLKGVDRSPLSDAT